jgi:tRNA-Thr(GGU) m(6)t(6)A37 methyltransferase TsaA
VEITYQVRPVGWVRSPLTDPETAPRQGDEGAPPAWLDFRPAMAPALADLRAGQSVIVLTWLDRARRDVLTVHPRGDASNPPRGVFSTRSPDRPNPIGLHTVRILNIDGVHLRVADLEAINETPILDIKPILGSIDQR